MDALLNIVGSLFPIAIGMIALNALLLHAYKLGGGRWRQLAMAYPMPEGRALAAPLAIRLFEMVELFEGAEDTDGQSWWVFARIYPDGLVISMPPIPMLSYPCIFIPLNELCVERRPWRLRSDAAVIAAPRVPALTIAIGDTLASQLGALDELSEPVTPRT